MSIISALHDFKLPKEATCWITDFLANRRQGTRIGHDLSTWAPITSGVPQGSVIGPLLFCMVIDNLSLVNRNSRMIKYAEDNSILSFMRKLADDTTQEEWHNVFNWSESVGLPINMSKSRIVNFVTKKGLHISPVCDPSDCIWICLHTLSAIPKAQL